jgi:hypothetical protein
MDSDKRRFALFPQPKKQDGQAVLEIIASMIMFTLMLAFVMSISAYLYFQQALVTAAREGARQAALDTNIGLPGTENVGISTVKTYVANQIQKLTGQTFNPITATITVVPPSQSASQVSGEREVQVVIAWQMKNPVGVAGFAQALGGDGSKFNYIPVSASATMRYEE